MIRENNYDKKIQEHKKAVEEVKKLDKIEHTKKLEFENDKRKIRDKYWDLQTDLDRNKREEFKIISEKENKFNEERAKQIKPHSKKISEFERIMEFMRVYKQNYDLNLEVSKYDYIRDKNGIAISEDKEIIPISPLSILKDDGFFRIGVYIYLNSKPKNKYTLSIIGRNIFGEYDNNLLNFLKVFEWNYLSDIRENGDFKKVLKELPDKNKLIEWFDKNKNKVFKEQMDKIEEIIKEYREVIKNTKSKDWEIAYLKNRKRYYENCVAGTEKEGYLKILLELKKLL